MNSAEHRNEGGEAGGVEEGSAGRCGTSGSVGGQQGLAGLLEEDAAAVAPKGEAVQVGRLAKAIERLLQRLAVDSAPVAVTKARAARELEVSVKTIGRMVRDGELSVITIRGRPRIPFSELLRVARVAPPQRSETRIEKFNARAAAEATRAALRRAR